MVSGKPNVILDTVWQQTGPIILARVIDNNGTYLTRTQPVTGTSQLDLAVYDITDPDAPTAVVAAYTNIADFSGIIFDALQTDSLWTKDAVGYNVKYEVTPAHIPNGDRVYEIELLVTPVTGQAFPIVSRLSTADRAAVADNQ